MTQATWLNRLAIRSITLTASLLSLVVWAGQGKAVALRSEVVLSTGLNRPIFAAAPEGDYGHLYIADGPTARIQRLDLATKQLTTVLDLPNVVVGTQSGLNGFAFHPDFENNGKIYVNLSGSEPAGDVRILEFTRSTTDPEVFDPDSRREIVSYANPKLDHWGGWLGFGPQDGYLYVATGDGGNVLPQETKGIDAQNVNDLKGKLLRIDVNGDDFPDDPLRNLAIPPTNPFAAGGGRPEIFAIGLRHPFRSGFDRATGDLYMADVGSRFWEEINFLPAGTNGGQNYGWRPLEGTEDNPDWADPAPVDAIDPIYQYPHGPAAAVIGGVVYRGSAIPSLQGSYIFGDFISKTFFTMRYDGQQITEFVDRQSELASPLGSYGGIANFAEDAAGEIYLIDYYHFRIYKIVAAPAVEQGDYNLDGIVDASDYTLWRDSLGQTGLTPFSGADGNGDGDITEVDYAIWKTNFGTLTDAAGGEVAVGNVPEATCGMLFAGALVGSGLRLRSLGLRRKVFDRCRAGLAEKPGFQQQCAGTELHGHGPDGNSNAKM